jgi:mono/diheme cytochrome c family protein
MNARPMGGAVALAAAATLLAGCRPNMLEQPRVDPFEPTPVFADGSSARVPVPGTIARGSLTIDAALTTGLVNGEPIASFPMPVTLDRIRHGRERFDIYCAPCHSRTGNGEGMVVRRGFRQPPSYFEPRLLAAPPGHFFDVITNGFGAMPPFNYLVPVDDRWAIAAYIRALQLSVVGETTALGVSAQAEAPRNAGEP